MSRMIAEAKRHGHGTPIQTLERKMPVNGVGENSSSCSTSAKVPIMLNGVQLASYSAPCVDQSDVPALLGTASMTSHRIVIDLVHDKIIMLGEGGMDLTLSPGSRVIPILRSSTGHLHISASEWNGRSNTHASTPLALPVL